MNVVYAALPICSCTPTEAEYTDVRFRLFVGAFPGTMPPLTGGPSASARLSIEAGIL